jgi:hypothetical protein
LCVAGSKATPGPASDGDEAEVVDKAEVEDRTFEAVDTSRHAHIERSEVEKGAALMMKVPVTSGAEEREEGSGKKWIMVHFGVLSFVSVQGLGRGGGFVC